MDLYTRENFHTDNITERVDKRIQQKHILITMENGKMAFSMEKERLNTLQGGNVKEYGQMPL